MGINATVLAFGPFYHGIRDRLEYSSDYYRNVKTGSIVFTELFYCRTIDTSRQLAKVLDVNIDDAATFELQRTLLSVPTREDALRRQLLELSNGMDVDAGDLDTFFTLLRRPGWRLFYRLG